MDLANLWPANHWLKHHERMPYLPSLQIFQVASIGVLTVFEFVVHYGIGAPSEALSAQEQVQSRQVWVRRLRLLAPTIFFPALALSASVCHQQRYAPGTWLRLLTFTMLVLWLAIRLFYTVPVNSATLDWNPLAPPADWRAQVNRTERFHVLAAWGTLIGLVCSIAAFAGPK